MANNSKPYASNFIPKKIAIYKVDQEDGEPYANLIGMASHFQYFEDIFTPTYAATLVVVDNAVNLISEMPIQGFEKVVIEVEDITEETYTYNFRVWTVGNRTDGERRQVYTLGLVSEEALINEGIRVNTIIKGETSQQVSKLLREKLNVPADNIDVETSVNYIKMLPTKKTPFAVIKSLQTKTISSSAELSSSGSSSPSTGSRASSDVGIGSKKASGTAGYLFYQTRKGFVFKSVDSLSSSDNGEFGGSPPVGENFIWSPGKTDYESTYKIQEIVFNQEIDMITKLRDGSYSSIVCFFNINTGKYEEYVYSLKDTWSKMVHMGSQTKLPYGQSKLCEYPSRVMSTIVNHENWYSGSGIASNEDRDGSDSPSEYPDLQKKYVSQSISRLGIMFNQKLTISLTGHLELVAGDKIEVRIPNQSYEELRNKEVWDPEHSGTYLIKKLNHQFDIQGKNVYTVLELIRDSFGIKNKESKVK